MKYVPKTNQKYKFNAKGEVFSLIQNRFLKCSNGFYSMKFEHGRRNIRKQALIELYIFLNTETKQIPGYSKYEITKDGEVYSTTTNCWIKPFIDKNGYKRIALVNDEGNRIKNPIHRLVAMTYISNPNNLPIVNHKDENKQNNNVDNLEWVTVQQNTIYSKPWLKRKRDEGGRFI